MLIFLTKYFRKQVRFKGPPGVQFFMVNPFISDEYFVSNIEKVDSVTLLRKDKLLTGVTWTLRFQHALTVWPCLNDLG